PHAHVWGAAGSVPPDGAPAGVRSAHVVRRRARWVSRRGPARGPQPSGGSGRRTEAPPLGVVHCTDTALRWTDRAHLPRRRAGAGVHLARLPVAPVVAPVGSGQVLAARGRGADP